ncbi:hypothetical protein ELI03_35340 [Rhizobium leguminosarum]|uniref:Uncharacterized protein n=1 Tax=Rhizobium leguminosarum TaxID=384 RepID=A0A4Q8XVQ5_RHILE|nr:hypothetical protein [Rhizobium leguminosarum]TAX64125.1 hypothetical protein ELI03_35340 [Rhizobium leguminosarum]
MSKRLSIYDDPSLPPGSVVLAMPLADNPEKLLVCFARRNSDRPHLGPYGWQAGEHYFEPREIRSKEGLTELVFGSEVTRHAAVDMDLTIAVPAADIRERHFWPDVAGAFEDGSLVLDLPSAAKRPEPTKNQPPFTPPAPPAPPASGVTQDQQNGEGPDDEPETSGTGGVDVAIAPAKKQLWPYLLFLLLVCVGAALGSYFYLRPVGENHSQPVENTSSAHEQNAPEPPPPPAQDFASRYKTYLDQQGHADELLALGNEALSANAKDVGFNAVTLSADRGSAAAKLLMGKWYDPLVTERHYVTANPNNAAVYYSQAAGLGAGDAKSALERLCLTSAANAGPVPDWVADFDRKTYCQ